MTESKEIESIEYVSSFAKCTVQNHKHCMVRADIEFLPEYLHTVRDKARRNIAKKITLPGFRKGHVPGSIIAERFPEEVKKEMSELLLEELKTSHLQIIPINPLNRESFRVGLRRVTEEEAQATIIMEVAPTVPTIDPTLCTLHPVEEKPLTDEMVDEVVRQSLFFYATWTPVEDREVREGDFIILDGEILDTEPSKALFTGTRFEVKASSMADWMLQLVLGKRPGDVMEGMSVPDEHLSPEEKMLYPPKNMRLTLQRIEQVVMPEYTPEFFAKLHVSSMEEMRSSIRDSLLRRNHEERQTKLHEQAAIFLLQTYPFEVPFSMIEKEMKLRLQTLRSNEELRKRLDALTKVEQKAFGERILIQAESSVRFFCLAKKLLDEQVINVPPVEVHEFMSKYNKEQLSVEHFHGVAAAHVLLSKLFDYVVLHAKIAEAESS